MDSELVSTAPKTVFSNRPVENVLLIGGAGYIGSVLVRQLLARGYRVRVLDRLMFGREPILDLSLLPRFELLPGDFRKPHVVAKAAERMDALIHLGAIVGDPACDLDERATVETNYEATALIAQAARDLGIPRVIFASTCSVYGTSNHTVDETAVPQPVSLYAATKTDSEKTAVGKYIAPNSKASDPNFRAAQAQQTNSTAACRPSHIQNAVPNGSRESGASSSA